MIAILRDLNENIQYSRTEKVGFWREIMGFSVGAVILAAGEGKRLKLRAPKPLAPCLDKCLVDYPLIELEKFFNKNSLSGVVTAVIGHQKELVQSYIQKSYSNVKFAVQEKQLGTGDALRSYFNCDPKTHSFDYTLVLCADTPLVTEAELSHMFNVLLEKKLEGLAASFEEGNPFGYGRIVRAEKGFKIIEEKDADDTIKKITEVNSGLYFLKTSYVIEHLKNLNSNNKAGEFYLTDVFSQGRNVESLKFNSGKPFLGVNTLAQLEEVESILRDRIKIYHRDNGVRFIDFKNCYIDSEVKIGFGSVIYPGVHLTGKSTIHEDVVIEHGAIVKDSIVEKNARVLAYSVLESAIVRTKAQAGPFARLRPGADLGPESKVGNFVEIKKSVLEKGVKVSHLSYIGDAFIGEESNIGCGFITCNYDGVNKNITKIGKNCFIGSDVQTIAPVEIGDDCFVAAASTVTHSMSDGSFAISRGKQNTKEGMASKFLKKKEKN